MKMQNKTGERAQPCLTPSNTSNKSVSILPNLTWTLTLSYKTSINLQIRPLKPEFQAAKRSPSRHTLFQTPYGSPKRP